LPRPPRETLFRVESALRKQNAGIAELSFGQRFKLNQITQRYAFYSDLWRKRLRDLEEGRGPSGGERATTEPATAPSASSAPYSFRVVCSNPEAEGEQVEQLLTVLLEAKRQMGEPEPHIDPALFAQFVAEKTRQFKESLVCDRVEFSVTVEEGKVKLKAGRPGRKA
jgi:hypothetical protein